MPSFVHGCSPAPIDHRDRLFATPTLSADIFPVDLRSQCPPVRSQGDLGACTAFSVTELYDFVRRKHNLPHWTPSPLFSYYATRSLTKQTAEDCGATVRNALKSTVNFGVAMEKDWPYDTTQFTINPPLSVWDRAEKHQTIEYLKLDDYDKNSFIGCLCQGYPFSFGLRLFTSFINNLDTVTKGIVKVPDYNTEKEIGGHCMLAVGYQITDGKEYLIVQNSWGKDWGDNGFCWIPLEYILSNYSFDFWTIRTTEVNDSDVEEVEPTEAPTPAPTETPTSAPTEAPTNAPTPAPTDAPVEVIIPELPPFNIWKHFFIGVAITVVVIILILAFAE